MTDSAQTTDSAPMRRNRLIIVGVVALAVIAGLALAFFLTREPEAASGDPSPSASPSPSAPASPSADPSPSEEPSAPASPSEEPVAAPEDWTQVHTIGDGSTRIVGGEIAWGDAGFLAVAKRVRRGGEGGRTSPDTRCGAPPTGRAGPKCPIPPRTRVSTTSRRCPARRTAATCSTRSTSSRRRGSPVVSLRSTDGETWEPLETGLPGDMYIQAIEEGPAGYLLVGGQGAETNPTLWLSSDALTWELVHEFSQDQQYVQLHDGDGGAEGYVVIGRRIEKDSSSYERFAFASADGREWVETAAPFGPDDQSSCGRSPSRAMAATGWRRSAIARTRPRCGPRPMVSLVRVGQSRRPIALASAGLFEEVGDELILAPGATVITERHAGDLVLDRWDDLVTDRPRRRRLARRAGHR